MGQLEERADELFTMGLRFNGDSYVGQDDIADFNVHWTEMSCDTDEQWKAKVDALRAEKAARLSLKVTKPQTVWVLTGGNGYEGDSVWGVYSSQEAALRAQNDWEADEDTAHLAFDIEAFEVLP